MIYEEIRSIFALDKASFEWVLSIDADEVLSNALIERLNILKYKGFSAVGYMIKRQNIAFGLVPKHFWEYQLRLFNKTKGKFVDLDVHEYVKVKGKVEHINEPIIHYTYHTITEQVIKLNKYSEMEAMQTKKKVSIFDLYLKPLYIFLVLLFKKGLIFDGIPGLHFAIMMAFYRYLVEFRIWLDS